MRHPDRREQQTLRRYMKNPTISASYPPPQALSSSLAGFHNSTVPTRFDRRFLTVFDSGFTDLVQLKAFDGIQLRFPQLDLAQGFWLDSNQFPWPNLTNNFWRDSTQIFSTQFFSRLAQFFLIWVTSFNSHCSQASVSPKLARVY